MQIQIRSPRCHKLTVKFQPHPALRLNHLHYHSLRVYGLCKLLFDNWWLLCNHHPLSFVIEHPDFGHVV